MRDHVSVANTRDVPARLMLECAAIQAMSDQENTRAVQVAG